jgi:hypothetical protein
MARRATGVAAVISGALILGAAGASADRGQAGAAAQGPAGADAAQQGDSWLSVQLDHVRLHKKGGLAYTRRLDRDDRDLVLSLHGPAMSHKRVGLAFEVRF